MPDLWLPKSFTGNKPKYQCRLCGQAEYTPEAQLRHVRQCYRRNESAIRMSSPRLQAPGIFGDDGVDTEFLNWHRERGYHEREDI